MFYYLSKYKLLKLKSRIHNNNNNKLYNNLFINNLLMTNFLH